MKIFDQVVAVLSELSGTESVRLEDELKNDIGLDSFGLVNLILTLEERFGITMDDSDMNPFDLINVQNVVTLVERYLNGESHE